jgi:hypothetical protein
MKRETTLIILASLLLLSTFLVSGQGRGRSIEAFDSTEINDTNMTNSANITNITENNVTNTTNSTEKKFTYGQCVSKAAKARNDCQELNTLTYKDCLTNAKKIDERPKMKNEAKVCQSEYRKERLTCKKTFKESKVDCQAIKHSILETLRYSLA